MTTEDLVHQTLFAHSDFSVDCLQPMLQAHWHQGMDAMDLYLQHLTKEQWLVENGSIKKCLFDIDCGAGFQVFSGLSHLHTSTQMMTRAGLERSLQQICAVVQNQNGMCHVHAANDESITQQVYASVPLIDAWTLDEKKTFLLTLYDELVCMAPHLCQSSLRLSLEDACIWVMDHEGHCAMDIRPMVRFDVHVVLKKNNRSEVGHAGAGGRMTLDAFKKSGKATDALKESVRLALLNFEADHAPAGQMPVVLGSGFTGVLLHEAIGHGLEADFIRKGSSCFTALMGEKVAASGCHIVDQGNLKDARGSLNVDDEGTSTQCTDLIVDGRVAGFMFDKHNARLMSTATTGNGRRESYAHPVLPRMTNTYMRPGSYHQEEMVASLSEGILALQFGGGQVDIVTGQFVFSATECYAIEHGKVTRPLKGVTLCGNGFETLQSIRMVGQDLAMDPGVAICGKAGQSVPVTVGQPSVLIGALGVGGTEV